MKILAARKYPNPRNGSRSPAEAETRRLAYAIKDPRSPSIDFDTAAREMARLLATPCWLVPIPASDGSTRANTILAAHIARHVAAPGTAQVAPALRRTAPTESQCARHRRNLPPTPPDAHGLKPTLWSLGCRQVYFVDNVATSGNTMRAAYAAMNRGAGLVFADAGGHTTNHSDPPPPMTHAKGQPPPDLSGLCGTLLCQPVAAPLAPRLRRPGLRPGPGRARHPAPATILFLGPSPAQTRGKGQALCTPCPLALA